MHINRKDFFEDIEDDAEKGLILLIMKLMNHFQKMETEKRSGVMKDEIGGVKF